MANEFKVKNGYVDLSITASQIVVTDANKKLVASGKNFNDAGTTVNDVWSALQTQTAINNTLGTVNAMTYKGVIDASGTPNYPAADAGDTYKISVAGKIGGVSGIVVEVGDMLICTTDGTVTGNQASVGTNWNIIQSNIDGAVTGPASATDKAIAIYNTTSGKSIQNSLVTIDASGSVNIPTGQTYKINNVSLSKSDIGLSAVTNDAQLKVLSNLGDLNSVSTARSNLGLGGAAVLNVGTTTGTVAAGDDSRIVNAVPNTRQVNGKALSADISITKSDVTLGNVTNNAQVIKAASSTNNAIVKWSGITGDTVVDSLATIDASGSINIPSGQTYKINNVSLSKSDIGLSNVTNNAQVNKVASSTNTAIVRWGATTGDTVLDSTVLLDNAGRINNYGIALGTSATVTADSFLTSLTTGVEWTIIAENGTTDSLIQKLVVWHDNATPLYNEYSVNSKGTGLTDLSIVVDINTNILRLRITNSSATKSYSIRTKRELL